MKRYLTSVLSILVLFAFITAFTPLANTAIAEDASICPEEAINSPENNESNVNVIQTALEFVEIEVDCFHYGHCWICDEYADYHCSPYGNYPGYGGFPWRACIFADPIPEGNVVKQIEATIYGIAAPNYGGTERAEVLVNGVTVGVGTMEGNDQCGTCFPLTVTSDTYEAGFPDFVYGGDNELYLAIDGVSCISDVHLKIYYGPPPTGCDLTPVLRALDLVEAKLDMLGKLPYIINDLFNEVMRLNKAVYMLEAKLDRVQKELSIARDERAAIESKLDNGEVITQSDLADGTGGVFIPGAKVIGPPGGPPITPK